MLNMPHMTPHELRYVLNSIRRRISLRSIPSLPRKPTRLFAKHALQISPFRQPIYHDFSAAMIPSISRSHKRRPIKMRMKIMIYLMKMTSRCPHRRPAY
ncbi:hypothetical protein FPRO04_14418 [Fusarium proliferatum]|nr:hypothetical protein FPRO04_14418 [Fusarium proliferatum]